MKQFFSYIPKLIFLSFIAAPLWQASYYAIFMAFGLGVFGFFAFIFFAVLLIFAFINGAFYLDWFFKDRPYQATKPTIWQKFLRTAHMTLPAAFFGYRLFELM